jgi:hypothetical protein
LAELCRSQSNTIPVHLPVQSGLHIQLPAQCQMKTRGFQTLPSKGKGWSNCMTPRVMKHGHGSHRIWTQEWPAAMYLNQIPAQTLTLRVTSTVIPEKLGNLHSTWLIPES